MGSTTRDCSPGRTSSRRARSASGTTPWPRMARALTPWARSGTPGYAGGGNKFDLSQWDTTYFRRLRDFVRLAGEHGVVVEVTLFSSIYGDAQWRINPLNRTNNVNVTDSIPLQRVHTLQNGSLWAHQ